MTLGGHNLLDREIRCHFVNMQFTAACKYVVSTEADPGLFVTATSARKKGTEPDVLTV
jgi:hypothetical protein